MQNDGRLKLHKGGVIFKANKTGKVDQAAVADIESTQWMRVARGFELNVALTNGSQFKFEGFKEGVSVTFLCYDKCFYCLDHYHIINFFSFSSQLASYENNYGLFFLPSG